MDDDYPELTYNDSTYRAVMDAFSYASQLPARLLYTSTAGCDIVQNAPGEFVAWIKDEDIKIPPFRVSPPCVVVEVQPEPKKSDDALRRAIGGR